MKAPLKRRYRNARAFTLIEVLVAVLLLTFTMVAITRLWSVSRSITERSRDWGEYYAVTRQEVERDKASQFKILYITENRGGTDRVSDYSEKGILLATGLTLGAAPTADAYYRAVSSYALVATGSDTDATRKLGVQVVRVYRKSGTTFDTATVMYQATDFYSVAGV